MTTEEGIKKTQCALAPPCSETELDTHLRALARQVKVTSCLQSFGHHWTCTGAALDQDAEVPQLVEDIRVATEWLVWAERHDAPFIDDFRKHAIFEAFALALRTDAYPGAAKIQVLQSISILLTQMKKQASIDYLLIVLNPLFEIPPDLEDEEMLGYFVTLLKSLSNSLNSQNVQRLIVDADGDENAHNMPLLNRAVSLAFHRDSMVQTAARTVVLNVLRVEHPRVRSIAVDVTKQLLVPSLASIEASIAQSREAARLQTYQWMWGDACTGGVAELNPLRWSSAKLVEETICDLRQESTRHGRRPVMLKSNGEVRRYQHVSESIAALQRMLRPDASFENLMEFVDDLLDLDIPEFTAALHSQGFGMNCKDNASGVCVESPSVDSDTPSVDSALSDASTDHDRPQVPSGDPRYDFGPTIQDLAVEIFPAVALLELFGPEIGTRCSACRKPTWNRGEKATGKVYCVECFQTASGNAPCRE